MLTFESASTLGVGPIVEKLDVCPILHHDNPSARVLTATFSGPPIPEGEARRLDT